MEKTEGQLLNWLNGAIKKDKIELDNEKKLFIEQVKKMKKEDLFHKPKKITLWQKIRIILLGN
jgi:hypothetical protein